MYTYWARLRPCARKAGINSNFQKRQDPPPSLNNVQWTVILKAPFGVDHFLKQSREGMQAFGVVERKPEFVVPVWLCILCTRRGPRTWLPKGIWHFLNDVCRFLRASSCAHSMYKTVAQRCLPKTRMFSLFVCILKVMSKDRKSVV